MLVSNALLKMQHQASPWQLEPTYPEGSSAFNLEYQYCHDTKESANAQIYATSHATRNHETYIHEMMNVLLCVNRGCLPAIHPEETYPQNAAARPQAWPSKPPTELRQPPARITLSASSCTYDSSFFFCSFSTSSRPSNTTTFCAR